MATWAWLASSTYNEISCLNYTSPNLSPEPGKGILKPVGLPMLNQGQTYLHKMEKGKGKKAKINRKISYVGLEDLILLECSYYPGDVQSQHNPY